MKKHELRFSGVLWKQIQIQAVHDGVSASEFVRRACRVALSRPSRGEAKGKASVVYIE